MRNCLKAHTPASRHILGNAGIARLCSSRRKQCTPPLQTILRAGMFRPTCLSNRGKRWLINWIASRRSSLGGGCRRSRWFSPRCACWSRQPLSPWAWRLAFMSVTSKPGSLLPPRPTHRQILNSPPCRAMARFRTFKWSVRMR